MLNRNKMVDTLNKLMNFSLYLFALGIFISKAATSISIGLFCLLWFLKIFIIDNYELDFSVLKIPIALHISSFIISAIAAGDLYLLDDSSNVFLAVLFYFALINEVHEVKIVKRIIKIASLSAVISVIYGLYQHYFIGMSRVESFSFSLGFGLHVSMLMIFTISYLIWGNINNKKKIILFISNLLLLMNLIFTKARGAWLAFLGGISILILLKKNKKIFLAFVLFMILLVLFLPQEYINRFESSFDLNEDGANQHRLELWEGAIEIYRDHFLVGVGFDRFRDIYVDEYYPERPYQDGRNAHNLYLHFLATTGTLGFLTLIYIFYSILKVIYLGYLSAKNKNLKLFLFSSFIAVIILLLQGFTRVSYMRTDTLRFFWFLIFVNVYFINNKHSGELNVK